MNIQAVGGEMKSLLAQEDDSPMHSHTNRCTHTHKHKHKQLQVLQHK